MEYGLIGEALSHSISPQIHKIIGGYDYKKIELKKDEVENFLLEKAFKAINVTIPYKKDVIPYLNRIDPKASKIGAVNTIVNNNGFLTGYNTDYDGFSYLLSHNGIDPFGKKVLVLGNGGAAQAILAVLKDKKARDIIIIKYKKEPGTVTYEEALALHTDAELLINTSPVGMYPHIDASPIDLTPYQKLTAVIDIIANPEVTLLMKQAESLHIKSVNGLLMLVAQAKYAVEYFTGHKVDDALIHLCMEKLRTMDANS